MLELESVRNKMTFKEFVDACNKELTEHLETACLELVKSTYEQCSDMFCRSEGVTTYRKAHVPRPEQIYQINGHTN